MAHVSPFCSRSALNMCCYFYPEVFSQPRHHAWVLLLYWRKCVPLALGSVSKCVCVYVRVMLRKELSLISRAWCFSDLSLEGFFTILLVFAAKKTGETTPASRLKRSCKPPRSSMGSHWCQQDTKLGAVFGTCSVGNLGRLRFSIFWGCLQSGVLSISGKF